MRLKNSRLRRYFTMLFSCVIQRRHCFWAGLHIALLILTIVPLSALDLTLNNQSHALLTPQLLDAHAQNGLIPLQSLFPWMESVDYLEANSGDNQVFWDASRLKKSDWNEAMLAKKDGIWEIRVGRDVFTEPERIVVFGTPLALKSITIWSTLRNPDLKNNLLSAFALRGLKVVWRQISNPAFLLADSSSEAMPHLVLLDDIDLLRFGSFFASSQPISGRLSTWWTIKDAKDASANGESGDSELSSEFSELGVPNASLALDAYHPEAPLLFLLKENPNFIDKDGRVPSGMLTFLATAAAGRAADSTRVSNSRGMISSPNDSVSPPSAMNGSGAFPTAPLGALVVTKSPLAALADQRVVWAVSLPSSTENAMDAERKAGGATGGETHSPMTVEDASTRETSGRNMLVLTSPPEAVGELLRVEYAALPLGVDVVLGSLLLADVSRFADLSETPQVASIPMDRRMVRFFDAYKRIGRLAISGQIGAELAVELINQYIAGE